MSLMVGVLQTRLSSARLGQQQGIYCACLRDFRIKSCGPWFFRKHSLWAARGFVGDDKSTVAGEYHSKDFKWDDLYQEVGSALDYDEQEDSEERNIYDPSDWEAFHAQHGKGHFFKERRYLMLEFPVLSTVNPAQYFIDIGSGCGSSTLPILKSNGTCSCTACDVSPTALQLLENGVKNSRDIDPARITTVVMDAAEDPAEHPCKLAGAEANCVLLNVLLNAAGSLQTGGLILFRDYGFCDMTQLRYKPQQRRGKYLYQRRDGTLAYYFTTEFISELMLKVGFKCIQCEYACVIWTNRKKNVDLKRVFVHGVFQKM